MGNSEASRGDEMSSVLASQGARVWRFVTSLFAQNESGLSWFWRWGALLTSLIMATAGTTMIGLATKGIGAPTTADPNAEVPGVDWLLLSWGIALLAISFACNIANQLKNRSHAKEVDAKRGAHLTRFNDELSSVIEVFIELLQSDNDEKAGQRFFQSAVREARRLVSYEGVRICVYQLEDHEAEQVEGVEATNPSAGVPAESSEPTEALTDQSQSSRVVLLMRRAYGGRSDPPRPRFTPDTEHGKAVISVAHGTSTVRIDDPQAPPLPTDRNPGAVWSSALLVPLIQDHVPKGILMIDTREPVKFTSEDVSIGWTIATIIALGMGSLYRGGTETKTEATDARKKLAALRVDTTA
ncbi:GAF domain-containing protein [Arthrobacter sp. zg-Y1110]|uniref:GAF domain-containing protein n=1 Tax=Arthrobacter sp. zg-Y1110 TaxID=2886932 RepID=UPI001D13889A|nr:GAF domain-containing protein [Arthrobacter sp. zg-Y1110]MCC3292135.1 GAF domain-containing protein [Arthrobacter sp. zg-Y1110]UWX85224.1 GAF domain-containing protein [Arthrobacter sp. zg-Y1110]